MMSSDVFDVKILTDKLSKLNTSQQSIESLSRWCITHQKKARHIVETWGKMLRTSQKEQYVSFLFLANDILQNSRRKGTEFVTEFWKILPGALKNIHENGDENAKKAVSRLVIIWEERKVFGSRLQSLKDEILGGDHPAQLVSNGKSPNPIKILKKDAQSLRIVSSASLFNRNTFLVSLLIVAMWLSYYSKHFLLLSESQKLTVGGLLEKIVTAFHSVHDENPNEEDALVKCSAAALLVERMEKDVDDTTVKGIQLDSTVLDQLQEQENILQQCVKQLESVEASRVDLVSQLKTALRDQETKLGVIHHQLQAARSRIEVAGKMKQKLLAPRITSSTITGATEPAKMSEHGKATVQATTGGLQFPGKNQSTTVLQLPLQPPQEPPSQPATSFAALASTEEENKKAAAAAVAAKLTASTSSALMLTSVLSSLVAEEVAARNGILGSTGFTTSLPPFSPEKRQKLESDGSSNDMGSTSYFTHHHHHHHHSSMPILPPVPTAMQSMSPATQMPPVAPLPPLPPPLPPTSSPANHFAQSAGMMLGQMPYGYTGGSLRPPPPPLPSHMTMTLAQPPPPQSQQLQLLPHSQQQQSGNGGYYGPPGFGSYGQSHQPTTPPVHRQ
ncbi:hypothetical protein Dimus_007530 [Dionaea muscipula]